MIKLLFKFIIAPIITILIFPLALLAVMYKSPDNLLTEAVASNEFELDVTSLLEDEMTLFLEDETKMSLDLALDEPIINGFIKGYLQAIEPTYLESSDYVLQEDWFSYLGSWIDLEEELIIIESPLEIYIPLWDDRIFTYKTSVVIELELSLELDEIVLRLHEVKLGHLPLIWMLDATIWLLEQFGSVELEATINEALGGIGTFSQDNRSMTISLNDLLTNQLELEEETSDTITSLLDFLESQQLFEFGVKDDALYASFNMGQLRSNKEVSTGFDVITSEAELKSRITALLDPVQLLGSLMSSTFIEGESSPYILLEADDLNPVLHYLLDDISMSEDHWIELNLDQYQVVLSKPLITFGETVNVDIPLQFYEISTPESMFETVIEMSLTLALVEEDLVMKMTSFNIGALNIEVDLIEKTLDLMNLTNFNFEEGQIIVADITLITESYGIDVTAIESTLEGLKISISMKALPVITVVSIVGETLDAILTDDTVNSVIQEEVESILQAALSGDQLEIEASITSLIETYNELPEDEQLYIQQLVEEAIINSGYTLEELFQQIP
jgi:hypothetical protein